MKREGKIQVWKDYQKEIADDHYFYVRSCIRQNFFPGAEQTFLKILRSELGRDIYENPHHTSCSGIAYHADVVPFDTIQTIAARQFALMSEAGYQNFAVSCITSFGIYSEIIETWKEYPSELEKIRNYLKRATGREFEVPQNVAHASDIVYKFREDIADKKKFPLINQQTGQPLKIVEHIGCHYSKMFPDKGVGGANPHHTSCSGIAYHADVVPFDTIQTIAARQFALMSEAGYQNFAVSCITSFGIYSEIIETWKEYPSELEKIRNYLKRATGREFEVPQNVAHASDIVYKFREDIADKKKFPLINQQTGQPLKIVEHIGCHYSKMFPDKGVGGAEFPHVLVGMIESWGGEVVDYPERRHCCGFGFRQYLVMSNRGYSVSNSRKKFESMEPYKPDAILCNCPGCPMFMDRWQYVIEEMEGKTYGENGQIGRASCRERV